MKQDFEFTLASHRKFIDSWDTTVAVRIKRDGNHVTIIFRTGELQFTKTFWIRDGKEEPTFEELAESLFIEVKRFCLLKKREIMAYDDLASATIIQQLLLDNNSNMYKLIRFHKDLVAQFSKEIRARTMLIPLNALDNRNRVNDFKYSNFTMC